MFFLGMLTELKGNFTQYCRLFVFICVETLSCTKRVSLIINLISEYANMRESVPAWASLGLPGPSVARLDEYALARAPKPTWSSVELSVLSGLAWACRETQEPPRAFVVVPGSG